MKTQTTINADATTAPEAAATDTTQPKGDVHAPDPEATPETITEPDPVVPDAGAKQNQVAPRSLIMKLAAVMGELGWIEKRGENKFFNYRYAMESDILDAIRSRLAVRHIFVQTLIKKLTESDTGRTQGNKNEKIQKSVVWTTHTFHDGESGESLEINGYGVGEDTADKGPYKAMTGAMKYAMSKNFLISSGDDPEKEEGDDEQQGANGKGQKKEEVRRASDSKGGQPGQDGGYDDAIIDTSRKSGGAGKNAWTRYGILTRDHGWISTFDPVMAEAANKMKGTGFHCRFKTAPDGQYVKLVAFAELDPDGNVARQYGEG